ncbi:hypothetical protein Psi02_50940 [Planotetraspora silvatica]|uniref:FXSXX-COOH protein n=1 Tax=Planotetraspora silvatica TaxID=234614 RepID=A0A8J3UQ31_9ACTN|nr:hypothetical protein Psi02_50940 [Planotetraspora silvatica]
MSEEGGTGLIDVSTIDLETLKSVDSAVLNRAYRRLATDDDGAIAGFQSAL